MICEHCGTETVTWRGPLSALTHTECSRCGGINCQRADLPEEVILADDVPDPPHVVDKRDAEIARLSAEVERLKSGNGDELAERAKVALDAAHRACFKHPERGPIGMSRGPFSGVNEALGLIAQLRASWSTANRLLIELQKAVFGGEPDPTLRAGNFVEMARSLHAACDGGRTRAEAAEMRVSVLESEVSFLRHYGNKDCTAYADEQLEELRAGKRSPI